MPVILSDAGIQRRLTDGSLVIHGLVDENIQPASVDLTLSDHFRYDDPDCTPGDPVDPFVDNRHLSKECTVDPQSGCRLDPGEFVLGSTVESIHLPADLVGRVDGKSSLGRLGLLVHATAGFIDPGFQGQITLEFSNVSRRPILLYPGMAIAQISFLEMDSPASRPYGHPSRKSKYQGQVGATASAYSRNDDIRMDPYAEREHHASRQ